MDSVEFARAVAEGSVDRARSLSDSQQWSPATVGSFNEQNRRAVLVLDEDLSAGSPTTAATSLIGDLVPAQRVMVARIRPFGLVVVGTITGDPNPWQTASAVKAGHGGYTVTTTGAFVKVFLGGEFYDKGANFIPGAAHTYTCATTGIYGVSCNVGYTLPASPHFIAAAFFRNGVEADTPGGGRNLIWSNIPLGNELRVELATELDCLAGDVLDLRVFVFVATNLTSGAATFRRVA